jgi:hypothetical protein
MFSYFFHLPGIHLKLLEVGKKKAKSSMLGEDSKILHI